MFMKRLINFFERFNPNSPNSKWYWDESTEGIIAEPLVVQTKYGGCTKINIYQNGNISPESIEIYRSLTLEEIKRIGHKPGIFKKRTRDEGLLSQMLIVGKDNWLVEKLLLSQKKWISKEVSRKISGFNAMPQGPPREKRYFSYLPRNVY